MLDAFRSASQTWIIKVLFAFLILSFGIWGVGDVIRQRVESTPAITVGDQQFSAPQVADRFRRDVDRMSQQFGTKLSIEQALQFGLLNQTVQRMVESALLDEAAHKQGMGVDDATLRKEISEVPAFQSQLKMFDKTQYLRVLASLSMTEKQFIALEKNDLARSQLIRMVTTGVVAPLAMAAPVYRYQGEKRVAEYVLFQADKMPSPAAPDAAALQKYYDAHKAQFQQPELRSITALVVHGADLAATIQVPDSDVEKAYQARLGEFQTAEKRKVVQVLFPDQEKAQAFYDKAKGAKDFMAAAKEAGVEATDMGTVGKAEMPLAELADSAFGEATGVIGPVQSTLGWHVLQVSIVSKGSTRPLSEVKSEIVAALVKDEVTNRLYTLSTKLEDSIGGGNDIEETAKSIGVKAQKIDGVDERGRDAAGRQIENPAVIPPVIATAFQTVQGGTSEVNPLPGNDGYYVLHVDKVTPASLQPLELIQPKVAAAWAAEQRIEAAKKAAEAAADRIKKGEPLSALAGSLKVETTRPFLRKGGGNVPPVLVAEMFNVPAVGGVAVVANGSDTMVARLKEIQAADPQGAGFESARNEVSQAMSEDLMQEYLASLKKEIGASVNMPAISQQFAKQ
jgi:peptidyl-prolyl cis-trans isomerase D